MAVCILCIHTLKAPELETVKLLHHTFAQSPEGDYEFYYESSDGSYRSEKAVLWNGVLTIEGAFSYVGPDGKTYFVQYFADGDRGFIAEGPHITGKERVPQHYYPATSDINASNVRVLCSLCG